MNLLRKTTAFPAVWTTRPSLLLLRTSVLVISPFAPEVSWIPVPLSVKVESWMNTKPVLAASPVLENPLMTQCSTSSVLPALNWTPTVPPTDPLIWRLRNVTVSPTPALTAIETPAVLMNANCPGNASMVIALLMLGSPPNPAESKATTSPPALVTPKAAPKKRQGLDRGQFVAVLASEPVLATNERAV